MSQKVFLITEFFDSSQNSTGYLIEKLYKRFLEEKDLDIVLLTKEDKNLPSYINAIYIQHTQVKKNKLWHRLSYELTIGTKYFLKSAKHVKRHDLVFTGTNPAFLLLIIYVLKKIIGFKWVLLVHDVFPENLVAAQIISKDNLVYKILKLLFNRIYASADSVIVIGKDMKQIIYKKTCKKNITVVPSWIDESDVFVESKRDNEILNQLGWQNDDKVIFQFFGNIGRVQGLDNLIQAIGIMKEIDNARFVFIGNGVYVEQLKQSIRNLDKKDVIYYGELDQNQKSIGLNACDISIVILAEGMLGLGVPSKAYYTMAADKLIFAIMDKNSEVYEMVNENNIGWTVEPYNIQEVAEKLDKAVHEMKNEKFNSPRQTLVNKYSDKLAMKKILEVVRSL